MKWIEPKVEEYEHLKPLPAWISVLVFLGSFVLCFIFTVLNWKQGKPVISAEFFVRILLLPLLFGGVACSVLYLPYEDWNERVDLWNNLCLRAYENWRWWAQERVAIIGSVTLTPEKDLGVRMLGLEGSPPTNAGKNLPLATERKEGSVSRVQQVLEQLVTPFAPYMTTSAASHTFSIVVQSEREEDLNDLRALLRTLVPHDFGFVQISRAAEPLDMGRVEQWLSGDRMPDYRLVLAYQLHSTGKEPTCSEAGVALLFASRTVVASSKGRLKPEAWLFRPVPATMDSVFEALKTMLAAQQTPNERIKHLWLTHVPGPGKHATLTAVKDNDLKLAAHDLDTAIGNPGPVNALLVQALAAQMVQHGQGTQLIATPHKARVMLNLLGTNVAPIQRVEERLPSMIGIGFTCMLLCLAGLVLLMLKDVGASAAWFIGVFAGSIVFLAVNAFGSFVRRGQVEHDFYRKLPW
ncbi:MAG: hypothetical protein AB1704_17665 [Pseudomonadota bacterium]